VLLRLLLLAMMTMMEMRVAVMVAVVLLICEVTSAGRRSDTAKMTMMSLMTTSASMMTRR